MFVMMKSKAINQSQKENNETFEVSLIKLFNTIFKNDFFKTK